MQTQQLGIQTSVADIKEAATTVLMSRPDTMRKGVQEHMEH